MTRIELEERKARILLVDDERINLVVLADLLRPEFELLIATDGAQGLRLAAEQQPDLILLDLVMPGMDGYGVCQHLQADPVTAGIPIIFITARTETEYETKGFDLGAVDYIAKPFNDRVVLARVRTHVRLKRQNALIEHLMRQDALTGIYNRRAFDETSEREWKRARRLGQPLSLLMMDIDHFKQYNDHYGHGSGDACLQRVGQTLSSCMRRPGDFIGRYGGEEFVSLIPQTDLPGALQLAEYMVTTVSALQIPHARSSTSPVVTISIGIATGIPESELEMAALKERADQMLYVAKAAGRNRAVAEIAP